MSMLLFSNDIIPPMPLFAQFIVVLFACLLKSSYQFQQSYACSTVQFTLNPESRPISSDNNRVPAYHYKNIEEILDQPDGCAYLNGNRSLNHYSEQNSGSLQGSIATADHIVTTCDWCLQCEQHITKLYNVLTEYASRNKVSNLYVVTPRIIENITHSNGIVQFAYISSTSSGQTPYKEICSSPDPDNNDALRNFSKTSVLFVSISFIILMVISLAWLVFYYVQRFRYAHAKDRMQRRLFNAAKKALTRIPTKPVKAGDKELDGSDCPVCIDPYRAGDIVRMLPCRHVFHKTCVDPWLLEHRTCPMCKSDILKAFGYQVNVNNGRRRAQFSGQIDDHHGSIHVESDRLSSNSTASESNAYPYPVVSEIHDPFSFTPSTSPQLMQVMNEMNARAFSIIPLTVHNSATSQSQQGTTSSLVPGGSGMGRQSGSHASSSGGRILRSAPGAGSSRKMRGHVVNLVHVRSRSLSQSQIPTNTHALGSLREASPPTPEERRTERRPSALFRSGVPSNAAITIEIPSCESKSSMNENSSRVIETRINVNPNSSVQNTQYDNDLSSILRMTVSQENVASPTSIVTVPSPISRGHSVKTIGTRQHPNKNFCRRVSGQPSIGGTFPMMPPMATTTASAVVSDANAKSARTVPLTSTISIESL